MLVNATRHRYPKTPYIGPPLGIIKAEPRQSSLLRRRRMTIALGMLAQGGIVIAADREQSDETLKSEQGKIHTFWRVNRGTVAISGAGNGPYLDALTAEVQDWFMDDNTKFKASEFGKELRSTNHAFYKKSVLPFVPYESSVDYELLVGFAPSPTRMEIAMAKKFGGAVGGRRTLWTSHKLSVLKEEPFCAVGIGRTTAHSLLLKYGVPFISIEIAATLAAYIVYQVKRTVRDVGLETDVLVISGGFPHHLTRHEITAMESRFSEYEDSERENLFYCFGGDLPHLEQVGGKLGDHKRREARLRRFFEKLNAKRIQKWPRL
jgi:20S proteasome alpha/beta subunit